MLQQTVLARKVRVDAPLSVTAVFRTHRRPELKRHSFHLPDVVPGPTRMLRAVANDRARGLAGARSTGILATSHEFVAFLDDDDAWKAGIANLFGRGI